MSLIISLVLPLIEVTYPNQTYTIDSSNVFVAFNKNFNAITTLSTQPENLNTSSNWLNGIFLIYITGFVIFLTRLAIQSAGLMLVVAKNGVKNISGLKVVENDRYGLPFSFFNIVFINPKFHHGTDLTNILAHEKVHICENHWFDLFLVELLTVFFWFNPFVWLFERSIKQNHEYLADEGVLAQGLSVGKYQAILINQLMGMQIIGITNNLNYSLNAKRMKMMTKTKTPKSRVYKMLWILPAIALILFAFAKPNYTVESKPVATNLAQQKTNEQTIKFTGRVVDEAGNPLDGASIVVYGGTTGTVSDNDGLFTLTIGKKEEIFITYVGYVSLRVGYEPIEFKLQKNPKDPITFPLVLGAIKLDIDEIISKGEPKEEVSEKSNINKDDEVFVAIEELPSYPGGMYAFAKEIKEKIGTLKNSGKVVVDFTVNKDGSTRMLSAKGDHRVSNAELPQIIRGLKKWTPGKQRGKAVPVTYTITLNY